MIDDNRIILYIDDEENNIKTFQLTFEKDFHVITAQSAQEALKILENGNNIGVIVTDQRMPFISGVELLEKVNKKYPEITRILLTAYTETEDLLNAINTGKVNHYIVKPWKKKELLPILNKAFKSYQNKIKQKQGEKSIRNYLKSILGPSKVICEIITLIEKTAWSNFSIIIQGETGTGKSYLAKVIHNISSRANKPFVKANIGTMSENIIESELFGHVKGAYTGAYKDKKGFFKIADQGTIFLDEIENLSLYNQSKLLDVVEDKKIYPVGSTDPVEIDVRIIAATNTNLEKNIQKNIFRQDLFYRLNEIFIYLPPLRERIEDIPFFANKFFHDAVSELGKSVEEINYPAMELLKQHTWKGNIRELKNIIKQAVLFSEDNVISPDSLDFLKDHSKRKHNEIDFVKNNKSITNHKSLKVLVSELEKDQITKVLKKTKGNKSKAASILQINYVTLLSKIDKYDIDIFND